MAAGNHGTGTGQETWKKKNQSGAKCKQTKPNREWGEQQERHRAWGRRKQQHKGSTEPCWLWAGIQNPTKAQTRTATCNKQNKRAKYSNGKMQPCGVTKCNQTNQTVPLSVLLSFLLPPGRHPGGCHKQGIRPARYRLHMQQGKAVKSNLHPGKGATNVLSHIREAEGTVHKQ